MSTPDVIQVVQTFISPYLQRSTTSQPIVLMTCGLAGAGKSTLVRAILSLHPCFTRISIDAIIASSHGIFGIDYPASTSLHAQYEEEADQIYLDTFKSLLAEGKDIVIERSFYAKSDRDEFRDMAEAAGARVVFVYLRAQGEDGKEILWRRICKRAEGKKTPDSALDIDRATFDRYWAGFEEPIDEGEIVIEVK